MFAVSDNSNPASYYTSHVALRANAIHPLAEAGGFLAGRDEIWEEADNYHHHILFSNKMMQPYQIEEGNAILDRWQPGQPLPDKSRTGRGLADLSEAAEQGDAKAQYYMGSMYLFEQGVPQDFKKAMNWFKRAAERGDPSSQYNVGNMYLFGHGVPQDSEEAVRWYQMAAKQGHEEARYYLKRKWRVVGGKG